MSEYIEREAAVDALNKALFAYEDETEERFKNDPELDIAEWFFHRIFVQHMNGIDRQTILDIPAADVRPVVKARWVYTDMSRLVCSNCGSPVAFALKADGWHHGDYCPNCGAEMEES